MQKPLNLTLWLLLGSLAEAAIFVFCYLSFSEMGEVFRYSARYSGRLSLLVYLICFFLFAKSYKTSSEVSTVNVRRAVTIFCVLHFIHFGFLATNIYLNDIQLIPYKLAGGFLAYLLILVYPFAMKRLKPASPLHFVYFYYVGLVMGITYLSRIKGQFEGASPEAFHYFGLAATILALIGFGIYIFINKGKSKKGAIDNLK